MTTLLLMLAIFSWKQPRSTRTTIDATIFKEEHQKNKVLSQYYRWFLVFERTQNDKRIGNHLDLLSDDVVINTYSGPLEEKEGMKSFLNFVKEWKNAHHIKNTSVTQTNDSTLVLEADILYQNILPDSTKNNYNLHYATTLKEVENGLPIFTKLELLPIAPPTESIPFKDAYIENRSNSFIYYWISLMDNLKENKTKFNALLASDYTLEFLNSTVTNEKEFQLKINEIESQIATSLHTPKNIKSILNSDGTISVSFDMEWKGITSNNDKLIAEIHHNWILENNLDDPYAKLKEIKIKQTTPFTKVDEF